MSITLTPAQTDRACGVLVAAAAGDALGAGYEFTHPAPDLVPEMVGGGLGGFAPGQWTDDTDQAVAIARVAATGADLRTAEALTRIAEGFADWYAGGPADVGIQTSAVLGLAGATPTGAAMADAARRVHERRGRSAGNGSLMRTGPVALAYLDDPAGLVQAAMAVSALTHVEDVAQEACALWCLMIRHTALTGSFPAFDELTSWMPDAHRWRVWLAEAESAPPSAFVRNGWAVGALQAAWSAITHTPVPTHGPACAHLVDALGTAIRIGHDTDTVAAIAGALLGARWGVSAVPAGFRRILHGWPGLTGHDLEQSAYLITRGGSPGPNGWPLVDRLDYADQQYGAPVLLPHPCDPGVLLSGAPALDSLPDAVDAVVSLCLTGRSQVQPRVEQVSFRLIDRAEPEQNPNLDFVLTDAARLVRDLREEGKTVLLHCVAAYSRTPAVGIAYALLRGVPLDEATASVYAALPHARVNRGFGAALRRLAQQGQPD